MVAYLSGGRPGFFDPGLESRLFHIQAHTIASLEEIDPKTILLSLENDSQGRRQLELVI